MKIEFLGHAAFRITASDGTAIVTDPYEPGGYGGAISYGKIQEPADIVTISHGHADHNSPSSVPGNPAVVKGAGRHKVKDIEINAVATFHDDTQGSQRGPNTVMVMTVDGINVCHLGDLGHQLNEQQRAAIDGANVLLVPVGGHFTVDAEGATKVVESLRPQVVIPMHFKTPKAAFPIAPVDDFLADKSNVTRTEGSQIELTKESLPSSTQIVVLKPAL